MISEKIVDYIDNCIVNKKLFADIVYYIHTTLITYMCLAYLLPKKFIYLNTLLFPIVLIHWLTNKHYCILTQLEFKLRGQYIPSNFESIHDDSLFVKRAINIELTNKFIYLFSAGLFGYSWYKSIKKYYLK